MKSLIPINETVQLINNNHHATVIMSLAEDIQDAMNRKPVKELLNRGAKRPAIENLLAVIVLKYASMLNLNLNLKEGQALEIAKALLDEFPYNSLDDFKIMLQRGVRAAYGTVYRFDISVAFEWMRRYIDEFYEQREQRQKKEERTNADAVSDDRALQYINQIKKIILETEPVKTAPAPPQKRAVGTSYTPDPEYIVMSEKRRQWMKECFEPKTGKPNDRYVSFEEWLKINKKS